MSSFSSYQARLESPEEKPEGTKPRQEGRPKPEVASSEVKLASADTALSWRPLMQSQRNWEGISTNPLRPMQHMLRPKLLGVPAEALVISAETGRVKPTPEDSDRWETLSKSTRLGRCRNDYGTIRGSFGRSRRSFARYAVAECLSAGEILSD